MVLHSDYENNGTNILLDANENAYGPSLSLPEAGKSLNGLTNGDHADLDLDLQGLNRYPDPYVCASCKIGLAHD